MAFPLPSPAATAGYRHRACPGSSPNPGSPAPCVPVHYYLAHQRINPRGGPRARRRLGAGQPTAHPAGYARPRHPDRERRLHRAVGRAGVGHESVPTRPARRRLIRRGHHGRFVQNPSAGRVHRDPATGRRRPALHLPPDQTRPGGRAVPLLHAGAGGRSLPGPPNGHPRGHRLLRRRDRRPRERLLPQ